MQAIIRSCLVMTLTAVSFVGLPLYAQDRATLERLGPDVLIVRDSVWNSNMIAIRTSAGLVIVDSFVEWRASADAVRTAGRLLGDTVVAAVINTHWHDDHAFGNQGFSGIPIIGARATATALTTHVVMRQQQVLRDAGSILTALRDTLMNHRPSSADSARITARLARVGRAQRFFTGLHLTPPNVLVDRDTTFAIGGVEIQLIHRGAAHTAGDVAVHVPRHRLLIVGDLAADSSFVRVDPDGNTSNWMTLLDTLIAVSRGRVDHVVTGHHRAGSIGTMEQTRALLQEVHDSVAVARASGLSLEQTKQTVRLNHRSGLLLYDLLREGLVEAAYREQGQVRPETPTGRGRPDAEALDLDFDPGRLWRTFRAPVLAVLGGKDILTPTTSSAIALRRALEGAGNPQSRVVVFPNADHLMCVADSSAQMRRGCAFIDGYQATMTEWIKSVVY